MKQVLAVAIGGGVVGGALALGIVADADRAPSVAAYSPVLLAAGLLLALIFAALLWRAPDPPPPAA